MKNSFIITGGKLLSLLSKKARLGHGSTWPGHIALSLNKSFIQDILRKSATKIIFVAGTNGKTTTTSLIKHIFENSGKTVLQNSSGANLLNGIASSLLLHASPTGTIKADYLIFEIDENTLPQALKIIIPDAIVLLNLFRDQLDRYGEVNTIAHKWQEALKKLPGNIQLFANGDDPQIAYIGQNFSDKTIYFGLDKSDSTLKTHEHAVDSTYCPSCGHKLIYSHIFYSHLGIWYCSNCKLKRPDPSQTELKSSLSGTYNLYNTKASVLVTKFFGVNDEICSLALKTFKPAFGRQEKLIIDDKNVEIILAKNPTGFNESLRTVHELKGKTILLVLNDNIADGKDVSWIWDVDFDLISSSQKVFISGSRTYDLAVRLKYDEIKNVEVEENLNQAIENSLKFVKGNETLFILPTYTAMLDVRKVLTGKKIL